MLAVSHFRLSLDEKRERQRRDKGEILYNSIMTLKKKNVYIIHIYVLKSVHLIDN